MSNLEFVASCDGIRIYRFNVDYFSLFNSPYYAHAYEGALDAYLLGDKHVFYCLTPGQVVGVRRIKAAALRRFPHSEFDYVILIRSEENPSLIVRVLHVKPFVEEGDQLNVGDLVGEPLRSGFFDPWTSLHAHIEVKYPDYVFRAKGFLPIVLNINGEVKGGREEENVFLEVIDINDTYILAYVDDRCTASFGRVKGLGVKVGERFGILDCGLPYYRRGGVILAGGESIGAGGNVMLGGTVIGWVCGFARNGVKIVVRDVSLECEGLPLKGISAFLSLSEKAMVKLVPYKNTTVKFGEGDL
ncbi:MAG: hypothetical protein QXZ24_01285, partial [Candidatus Jordarchaeales archaeon]